MRALRALRRWAFLAIPGVGVVELAAHVVQTTSVAPDADWASARAYVAAQAAPDDLIAFAPPWADPLARHHLGADLATVAREARPDESRFARAFEVSIRGAHLPELANWNRKDVRRFGAVTVTSWQNPTAARVIDDLVTMVAPAWMQVSRLDGARALDCPFVQGATQSGGLGYGPAIQGNHFVCPGGGLVTESVVADLEYRPRRCIYAPLSAGVLRVRFLGVRFGRFLHGHHGLYVEAERGKTGAPVTMAFKVGDSILGSVVHNDGEGWKPFELLHRGARRATLRAGRRALVGR